MQRSKSSPRLESDLELAMMIMVGEAHADAGLFGSLQRQQSSPMERSQHGLYSRVLYLSLIAAGQSGCYCLQRPLNV